MLQHLNLATYHNSLARSTKSTRSLALPLLVSIQFQILFHSPPGVLFTVLFSIGHWVVFRLGGWSLPLQTGFHVSGPTLVPPACLLLRVQDCYLLRLNFPDLFRSHNLNRVVVVRNPELQAVRFGLFPFRSPLLFLRVLRCFSSPRSPRYAMYLRNDTYALPYVGFPIRKSAGKNMCF